MDFKNIYVYDKVDSTNNLAKSIAQNSGSFIIVTANEQTKGRGRMGREFYSPPDTGIYLSVVIKPKITLEKSALITTSTAVAVCNVIEKLTKHKPKIKWVNDIFIENKKVCGILTEAVSDFENGVIQYAVIGIGINFTTKKFPDEIENNCYSLYEENSVSRNKLIAELCNEIYLIMNDLENIEIMKRYKDLSCVINKEVYFIQGNKKIFARAIDIDDDGSLILDIDGEIKTVSYGEISIRLGEQ